MRYKPEIRELVAWLKVEGNSTTKLANALSYKSSTTINKWISANRIPLREIPKVLSIIRTKDENHVNAESSHEG